MKPKVAIVRCNNYEPSAVRAAVGQAIELLGGITQFISGGQRVLVKPNLLSARSPECAVTTHPAVVEAVIEALQKAGSHVILGDSPPLAGEKESGYQRLLKMTGMTEVAERTGAEVVRFEEESCTVQHPNGRYYRSFEVAKAVVDADVVISIPKLKTHGLTYLSAAVKNIFGCVPGKRKALFHAQAGDNRETFAQMLVDLLGAIPPRLSIVDAITTMEGDGPVDGKPLSLGLIIAGTDPVAVDAVACSILGVDPLAVLTTRIAASQGLGVADLAEIEVVGERIEDVRTQEFLEPRSKDLWQRIPKPIRSILKNQLVPYPVINNKCINCVTCVNACPVAIIEKGAKRPQIELSRCIRCYCCREVCEKSAIDLKLGRLSAGIQMVRRVRQTIMGRLKSW